SDTRPAGSVSINSTSRAATSRVSDIGGPTVLDHSELGQIYLLAHNSGRRVMKFTFPGRVASGYRSGANLSPQNAVGTITFQDYLGSDA
ncbi:SDR family oxidoreductase, partial [Mycobacterium sp. NPDC003449]